jgi:mRNA-degrading endonuclease RelE of RelBE toxin-antitoxin system
MKSRASSRFWKLYEHLPKHIQHLAKAKYRLWRENPSHPSLAFKQLHGGNNRFSARIGDHYRAIGRKTEDGFEWVWIGSHEEYNKLIGG